MASGGECECVVLRTMMAVLVVWWLVVQAPEMKWTEGNEWSTSIFVEAGAALDYKYVV